MLQVFVMIIAVVVFAALIYLLVAGILAGVVRW